MSEARKRSAVETAKANSQYLGGEIAAELADGQDHFGKDSVQLLKHHGVYQQDDRDARNSEGEGKSDRSFGSWCARRYPAGNLPASSCWPNWTCATKSATRRCG